MSQENVETVRDAYRQFAQGDYSPWADLPDDFEYVAAHNVPDPGTYRGEAAKQWMRAWMDSFEGHTIEATEILDAGDKVVVGNIQRGRPRGSNILVEGHWWQVWTFRGGDVARVETFPERARALKAAGLSGVAPSSALPLDRKLKAVCPHGLL